MSTQVYLSTCPRKKRLRSVPFSWTISEREIRSGSLTSSAPPSPHMTFFVSWKLSAATLPMLPSGRPR